MKSPQLGRSLHLRGFPPNIDSVDCDGGAFHRILAVIEQSTRRIRILGAAEHPVQSWVVQLARNLRAPRGALLYRPRSGQGMEGVSLDLMADP